MSSRRRQDQPDAQIGLSSQHQHRPPPSQSQPERPRYKSSVSHVKNSGEVPSSSRRREEGSHRVSRSYKPSVADGYASAPGASSSRYHAPAPSSSSKPTASSSKHPSSSSASRPPPPLASTSYSRGHSSQQPEPEPRDSRNRPTRRTTGPSPQSSLDDVSADETGIKVSRQKRSRDPTSNLAPSSAVPPAPRPPQIWLPPGLEGTSAGKHRKYREDVREGVGVAPAQVMSSRARLEEPLAAESHRRREREPRDVDSRRQREDPLSSRREKRTEDRVRMERTATDERVRRERDAVDELGRRERDAVEENRKRRERALEDVTREKREREKERYDSEMRRGYETEPSRDKEKRRERRREAEELLAREQRGLVSKPSPDSRPGNPEPPDSLNKRQTTESATRRYQIEDSAPLAPPLRSNYSQPPPLSSQPVQLQPVPSANVPIISHPHPDRNIATAPPAATPMPIHLPVKESRSHRSRYEGTSAQPNETYQQRDVPSGDTERRQRELRHRMPNALEESASRSRAVVADPNTRLTSSNRRENTREPARSRESRVLSRQPPPVDEGHKPPPLKLEPHSAAVAHATQSLAERNRQGNIPDPLRARADQNPAESRHLDPLKSSTLSDPPPRVQSTRPPERAPNQETSVSTRAQVNYTNAEPPRPSTTLPNFYGLPTNAPNPTHTPASVPLAPPLISRTSHRAYEPPPQAVVEPPSTFHKETRATPTQMLRAPSRNDEQPVPEPRSARQVLEKHESPVSRISPSGRKATERSLPGTPQINPRGEEHAVNNLIPVVSQAQRPPQRQETLFSAEQMSSDHPNAQSSTQASVQPFVQPSTYIIHSSTRDAQPNIPPIPLPIERKYTSEDPARDPRRYPLIAVPEAPLPPVTQVEHRFPVIDPPERQQPVASIPPSNATPFGSVRSASRRPSFYTATKEVPSVERLTNDVGTSDPQSQPREGHSTEQGSLRRTTFQISSILDPTLNGSLSKREARTSRAPGVLVHKSVHEFVKQYEAQLQASPPDHVLPPKVSSPKRVEQTVDAHQGSNGHQMPPPAVLPIPETTGPPSTSKKDKQARRASKQLYAQRPGDTPSDPSVPNLGNPGPPSAPPNLYKHQDASNSGPLGQIVRPSDISAVVPQKSGGDAALLSQHAAPSRRDYDRKKYEPIGSEPSVERNFKAEQKYLGRSAPERENPRTKDYQQPNLARTAARESPQLSDLRTGAETRPSTSQSIRPTKEPISMSEKKVDRSTDRVLVELEKNLLYDQAKIKETKFPAGTTRFPIAEESPPRRIVVEHTEIDPSPRYRSRRMQHSANSSPATQQHSAPPTPILPVRLYLKGFEESPPEPPRLPIEPPSVTAALSNAVLEEKPPTPLIHPPEIRPSYTPSETPSSLARVVTPQVVSAVVSRTSLQNLKDGDPSPKRGILDPLSDRVAQHVQVRENPWASLNTQTTEPLPAKPTLRQQSSRNLRSETPTHTIEPESVSRAPSQITNPIDNVHRSQSQSSYPEIAAPSSVSNNKFSNAYSEPRFTSTTQPNSRVQATPQANSARLNEILSGSPSAPPAPVSTLNRPSSRSSRLNSHADNSTRPREFYDTMSANVANSLSHLHSESQRSSALQGQPSSRQPYQHHHNNASQSSANSVQHQPARSLEEMFSTRPSTVAPTSQNAVHFPRPSVAPVVSGSQLKPRLSSEVSNESILLTPSSLTPSMTKTSTPTPPPILPQQREVVSNGLRAKPAALDYPEERPARGDHLDPYVPVKKPVKSSLDVLASARQHSAAPIEVPIPIAPIAGRKSPGSKGVISIRLFSRKYRSVSAASMEAIDGAATVVGSPTASLYSQSGLLPPPVRDPQIAAEEWRNKEDSYTKRGTGRRKRPGVTFDLEEEGPPEARRPPPRQESRR